MITKYFWAEKAESLIFIMLGILALASALYLFIQYNKKPFLFGMAFPLVIIALIQFTVGITVFFRSNEDAFRVTRIIEINKPAIQKTEIPRMEKVMKNFVIYRWVEIALIAAGIVLFLFFPGGSFWKGVGAALSMQATLMLILDFFAEKRGKEYLDYLLTLI